MRRGGRVIRPGPWLGRERIRNGQSGTDARPCRTLLPWKVTTLVTVEDLPRPKPVEAEPEDHAGLAARPDGPSAAVQRVTDLAGKKILFVDAENTIVRRPDGRGPEGIAALEEALRRPALHDVLIVASGSWKDGATVDEIRTLFSPDIAARIVDRTPCLDPPPGQFKPHVEIFAWLHRHPQIARYCVLEPSWPLEPHVECAVFIADGLVFGESPRHVRGLERSFGNWWEGAGQDRAVR